MKSSPALAALNISKSILDPAKPVSEPLPPQLQLPPQISISCPAATSALSDQDRRVRDRALAAEDATKKQRQLEAAAHAQDTWTKQNALLNSANVNTSMAGHPKKDVIVPGCAHQDETAPHVELRKEENRPLQVPYEKAKLGCSESSPENQGSAVDKSMSAIQKSGLPLSPPTEPSDLTQQAPAEANYSGLLAGRQGIPTNVPPVHLSGFGGASGRDDVTQEERDRARHMVEEFLRSRQMLPNVSELQAAHPPAGSPASAAIDSTLQPPPLGHEQMMAANANGEDETDEVFCFDRWPHSNARREAEQPVVSNPSPELNDSWVIPGLAEPSAQQCVPAAWGLAGPHFGDTAHGMGRTVPFDPFRPFPNVPFPQFQNGPGISNMDGLLMRGNGSALPGFLGRGGLVSGGVDDESLGFAGGAPLSAANFSGTMPWPPSSLHGAGVGAQELCMPPPWAHSKGGGGLPPWAGEPFHGGPFGAGPSPQGPLSGDVGGGGSPLLAPRTDQTASDALKSLLGIMPSTMADVAQRVPAQVLPAWADVTADPAIAQIIKPPPAAPVEATGPRPVASTSLAGGVGNGAAGGGAPAARNKAIKDPNASAGGRPPAGSSAENKVRSTLPEGGGGGGRSEARPAGAQGTRAAAGEGRRTGAADPGAAKSSGGQVVLSPVLKSVAEN
jgi:hypothetical protein